MSNFDAAEEAAIHAIDLLLEKGEQIWVEESHRVLGAIYQSKGEMKKAVSHLEIARGLPPLLTSPGSCFWFIPT